MTGDNPHSRRECPKEGCEGYIIKSDKTLRDFPILYCPMAPSDKVYFLSMDLSTESICPLMRSEEN